MSGVKRIGSERPKVGVAVGVLVSVSVGVAVISRGVGLSKGVVFTKLIVLVGLSGILRESVGSRDIS